MNIKSILKQYWGYDDFRGIQREIIESIMEGHDTLGLMPTGGGKSITFQVPALAQEGVCVVITPLIALMTDQVENLRKRSIRAAAIHSGLSHDDTLRILENAVFGAVKLLYVSPERLSSELFLKKLSHMKVSFVCVDEAHCISQWGYDFRPSYLEIAKIRRLKPDVPVLALTATATPSVVQDIQDKLGTAPFRVFRMSFERANLVYVVRHASDKEQQMLHILGHVPGSAIIYTRSRRRTKELAQLLSQSGISATFFHAGLDSDVKVQRQKEWQAGTVRVMVATNAFGMGIDKPDVRLVLHADCPDSLEAYFQEAGRAGRDGQRAYAVLLYNNYDTTKLRKRIDDTFPSKDEVRQVYDHLAYFFQVGVGYGYGETYLFPIDLFCRTYHHFPTRVESALNILTRAGYIDYHQEEDCQARVRFDLERDDLYRLRDNPPEEDALIVALLRNYTGLFNDYCYIDEALLSRYTSLTRQQIYMALKSLAHKRIISFIPERSSPYVRYKQRREDSEYLRFPPEVYDLLKERYVERISQMIAYATTDRRCRSSMLLDYFGEHGVTHCGHCDVCLSHDGEAVAQHDTETHEAAERIVEMLSDGQPHHVAALHAISLPYPAIEEALEHLLAEEMVTDDDGMLQLRRDRQATGGLRSGSPESR